MSTYSSNGPLAYLSECLGLSGTRGTYAEVQTDAPKLSRGQIQLNRVKKEKTHLELNRELKLTELKRMCTGTRINAKDARVIAQVRSLQRIDNQIMSYQTQEKQLEQVIHQDEMATIANETLSILKQNKRKAKQRKYDAEVDIADELFEDNEELNEHIQYMTNINEPSSESLEDVLAGLLPGVDIGENSSPVGVVVEPKVAEECQVINLASPPTSISNDGDQVKAKPALAVASSAN